MCRGIALLILFFLLSSILVVPGAREALADLFDRATDSFEFQQVRRTYYDRGQGLVGGLVPSYPHTLQRRVTGYQVSTPCGAFGLTGMGILENLKQMLDPGVLVDSLSRAIQDSIQNLVGAAISQLSMMTVCYAVPTLCDLVKHMQATAAGLHNIRALSCQELQGKIGSLAQSFGQARQARCMANQVSNDTTLNMAQRVCASGDWSAGDGGFTPDPTVLDTDLADSSTGNPPPRESQDLIGDAIDGALAQTGAALSAGEKAISPEERYQLKEFAKRTVGTVKVQNEGGGGGSTGGAGTGDDEAAKLDFKPEPPTERLFDVYTKEAEIVNQLMDCAVKTVGAQSGPGSAASVLPSVTPCAAVERWPGGASAGTYSLTTAEEIIQAVSLPMLPMPHGILRSLNDFRVLGLQEDYTRHVNKISGNVALIRVLGRTHQVRDRLEQTMLSSEDMTDEEREQIRVRIARLDREAKRLVEEKELAERHLLPAMDAMLVEASMRQREAAGSLMTAPSGEAPGYQNPFGYGY